MVGRLPATGCPAALKIDLCLTSGLDLPKLRTDFNLIVADASARVAAAPRAVFAIEGVICRSSLVARRGAWLSRRVRGSFGVVLLLSGRAPSGVLCGRYSCLQLLRCSRGFR